MHKEIGRLQFMAFAMAIFAVQWATNLQLAYTSDLFTILGAKSSQLSYLWLAAPITGLVIQFLLGPISDATQTSWGKRRPYLLVAGILFSISVACLAYSHALWVAVLLLWILYLTQNASLAMTRALTGDITPSTQLAPMYTLQTVFTALGAIFAGLIPLLLTHFLPQVTAATKGSLSPIVKGIFMVAGIVGLLGIVGLFVIVKETPAKIKRHTQGLKSFFQDFASALRHIPTAIKFFFRPAIFYLVWTIYHLDFFSFCFSATFLWLKGGR